MSEQSDYHVSMIIGKTITTTLENTQKELKSRAYRASNELRNASLFVLRGQRSGNEYTVPGTGRMKYNKKDKTATIHYKKYRASAPGEPPAVRTGVFRLSWGTRVHVEKSGNEYKVVSSIESNVRVGNYLLGEILEEGSERMAPRPYKQRVRNRAMPKIQAIYNKPYKV